MFKLTIIIFHKKVNNVQAIPSRMKAPPISLSDTVMEGSFLFLRKNIRINATKKSLKYNICKSVYMAIFFTDINPSIPIIRQIVWIQGLNIFNFESIILILHTELIYHIQSDHFLYYP